MKRLKSIVFCIRFVLMFLGIQIVSGATIGFFNIFLGTGKARIPDVLMKQIFMVQILAVVLFVAVVKLYQKKSRKRLWNEEQKVKSPKLRFASVVLALSYSVIWSILTSNYQFENRNLIKNAIEYHSNISPAFGYFLMILSVIIAAPVVEELLYRRIMISELRKSYPVYRAVIISSVFFGVVHIMAGGIVLVIGAFIMGLILGYIYVCTGGSFWVAVAGHALANCADYILMMIPESAHIVVMIGLLVVCVICVKYIYNHSSVRCGCNK